MTAIVTLDLDHHHSGHCSCFTRRIDRIRAVLRAFGTQPRRIVGADWYDTRHGHHVVLTIDEYWSDEVLLIVRACMGDDPQRVAMDFIRLSNSMGTNPAVGRLFEAYLDEHGVWHQRRRHAKRSQRLLQRLREEAYAS